MHNIRIAPPALKVIFHEPSYPSHCIPGQWKHFLSSHSLYLLLLHPYLPDGLPDITAGHTYDPRTGHEIQNPRRCFHIWFLRVRFRYYCSLSRFVRSHVQISRLGSCLSHFAVYTCLFFIHRISSASHSPLLCLYLHYTKRMFAFQALGKQATGDRSR